VGGAIANIESAAESHDWEDYASHWDLEAVGVMYEEDSAEIADRMWMDALEDVDIVPDDEAQVRAYYPEDVMVTRESLELGLQEYVETGARDVDRGFATLISLDNVASARVRKDSARVTFRLEGHAPDKLVLEFWRVVDGSTEKWLVSRITNAKDIAEQQYAF